MIDIKQVRADFPILNQQVNGEKLVYFDNSATSQTPLPVLDAIRQYYLKMLMFITVEFIHWQNVPQSIMNGFVNKLLTLFMHFATSSNEIIFTRSTTESLNDIFTWIRRQYLTTGDEIIISIMEHPGNLVPWRELAARTGAKLKHIELDNHQELDLNSATEQITPKTKIVAVTIASNVLGTTNPIKQIAQLAHHAHAWVVVDLAQYVGHHVVDVQDWDADFVAFSGHKMLESTGIGVLYGRQDLLNIMHPVNLVEK